MCGGAAFHKVYVQNLKNLPVLKDINKYFCWTIWEKQANIYKLEELLSFLKFSGVKCLRSLAIYISPLLQTLAGLCQVTCYSRPQRNYSTIDFKYFREISHGHDIFRERFTAKIWNDKNLSRSAIANKCQAT